MTHVLRIFPVSARECVRLSVCLCDRRCESPAMGKLAVTTDSLLSAPNQSAPFQLYYVHVQEDHVCFTVHVPLPVSVCVCAVHTRRHNSGLDHF